jgi:5-methyltetrahydrofolate--homocysteine methyltransferase
MAYKKAKVAELVQAEISAGTDVNRILVEGLIAPLDEVGKKFSSGQLFVPEMLAAAHAMKEGLKILRPLLAEAGTSRIGTVVIGTVKGDLHDIGKNIVIMMLEGAGFEVIDLGVDVEAEKFVTTALEKKARIVALSALLTTTMPEMRSAASLIKKKCPGIKIIVGGAPITNDFARQIGADGFSIDAPGAVQMVRDLMKS